MGEGGQTLTPKAPHHEHTTQPPDEPLPALRHLDTGTSLPVSSPLGWCVHHAQNGCVYAATRSALLALRLDTRGAPSALISQLELADHACHLEISRCGGWLLGACYGSGRVFTLRILADGALSALADSKQHMLRKPDARLADRQEAAHPHQVRIDPRNSRWVLVPDLGADMVFVYSFDALSGALCGADTSERHLRLARGSGPRHLDFSPNGRYVFVACELDGTVTTCHWDGDSGRLSAGSVARVMAPGVECSREHHSGLSHICCAADGRTVYVASRTDGQIVWLRVGPAGALERLGSVDCGGICPRHFQIVNEKLFVANQDSHCVCVFAIDARDGSLARLAGEDIDVGRGGYPEMLTPRIEAPRWC